MNRYQCVFSYIDYYINDKCGIGKKAKSVNITSGSITVEAAFVMPIVILTIMAFIYLAFYLHDVCRIQGVVDKTLNKAGMSYKHEADLLTGKVDYGNIDDRGVFYLAFGSTKEEERQIHTYLLQELSEGLFLIKATKIEVDVGKFNLSVSVKAEAEISLPIFHKLFNQLSEKVIKGEYPIHDPSETIRYMEVILDTGSRIKGVNELKEKLESFFNLK